MPLVDLIDAVVLSSHLPKFDQRPFAIESYNIIFFI